MVADKTACSSILVKSKSNSPSTKAHPLRYVLQMLALSGLAVSNAQAQPSNLLPIEQRFDIPAAKLPRPLI